MIDPLMSEGLSVTGKVKNEVVYLSQEKYSAYLERYHESQHYDLFIKAGEDYIPANKTILSINSQFF